VTLNAPQERLGSSGAVVDLRASQSLASVDVMSVVTLGSGDFQAARIRCTGRDYDACHDRPVRSLR
jgi:hypothetical protein